MLWKLWAKSNGEHKYVRTPDSVGEEQLALFLFSHPADESNTRIIGKSSARRNIFGAGTMSGSEIKASLRINLMELKKYFLKAVLGQFEKTVVVIGLFLNQ